MKRCLLRGILSLLTWTSLMVTTASAAEFGGAMPVAARESGISEVLALRPRAARGDVAAQVTLGDLFNARGQHAEAIYWYRSAATNGDVTAQLALAGHLIAGRGTQENRREAAHWMRLAAVGIEQSAVGHSGTPPTSQVSQVKPIILTRSNTAPVTVRSAANGSPARAETKNLFTIDDSISTRVVRDDNLSAVEPRLQERSVGLQPSATPK